MSDYVEDIIAKDEIMISSDSGEAGPLKYSLMPMLKKLNQENSIRLF